MKNILLFGLRRNFKIIVNEILNSSSSSKIPINFPPDIHVDFKACLTN